jgi:cell division transport system permease protein
MIFSSAKTSSSYAPIPLGQDASTKALPPVLCILVLLGVVLLAAGLLSTRFFSSWQAELSGKATIQVLPLDERSIPFEDRVQAALKLAQAQNHLVVQAEIIGQTEMQGLLAPWLGEGADLGLLPVPALIAIELKQDITVRDLLPLRAEVEKIAGASLDDHTSWLVSVQKSLMLLSLAIYALVALVLCAVVLIVFLLTRAGLGRYGQVVSLLHLVGAEDSFIIRQFVRHMLKLAGKGVGAGLLLSAVVVWSMLWHLQQLLPQQVGFSVELALGMLVFAGSILLLVWQTTRATAQAMLADIF